jgi:cytochrome P450
MTMRRADEDVEHADVLFPKDSMVRVNTFAAKRDPAVYDDPDRFDITRDLTPSVMTFVLGVHLCLGANLARKELSEAFKSCRSGCPTSSVPGPRHDGRCWA